MILRIGTLVLLKAGVQLVNSAYVWEREDVMGGWVGGMDDIYTVILYYFITLG